MRNRSFAGFALAPEVRASPALIADVSAEVVLTISAALALTLAVSASPALIAAVWDKTEHQCASHQAKKSQNKTLEVFFHAAFDFDAPRLHGATGVRPTLSFYPMSRGRHTHVHRSELNLNR